ncbi:helix-turn-helix domain-containing protein [Streptosporangium sp. NPDC002721]|uniref:helix-turn-helix domain-containing protein n=1 Tax=Streptosporangium sp. NPDC002721 TaxID=3366188 RepID=UPI0036C4A136
MAGQEWGPDPGGEGESTGRRIARARKRRGLTQIGLAAKANVSRSLIAQVEAGHKRATPSLVAAVARACAVDAAEIVGWPHGGQERGGGRHTEAVHAAMPSIRRALAYADVSPDLGVPPRSLDALASELVKLQRLQGAAAHVRLGARLPAAIEELTVHAVESDLPRAWRLLNHAYAIAVSLARRLGHSDLAQVAVERAAIAAPRADDPHLRHLVSLSRALLLLTLGSEDIALTMVRRAAGEVDRSDPAGLQVYGSLQLRAAVSAARMGYGADAWEHHGLATEAAARIEALSRPDPYGLQVSPVNAVIHGCAVATELGDYDTAVRLDSGFTPSPKLYAERRAHHEIDMSRTHLLLKEHDKALRRVLNAERIAPQMARFHPTAREAVRQLGTYYRTVPEQLRGLENRMAF